MTVALSAFYDVLMPELPGATTAMVDLHLRHVAREFCEDSAAWRVDYELPTVADEATYDVSAPELSSEIVRVIKVSVNDVLLWDAAWKPQPRATANIADVEPKYSRTDPPFSVNVENTELTLSDDETPTAADADGLAMVLALKPSFDAAVLPDFLKNQHIEAMRCGTLARLMRMGKKPWTDRELSVVYEREYRRLITAAAHNAQLGNTGGRLRTRKTGI